MRDRTSSTRRRTTTRWRVKAILDILRAPRLLLDLRRLNRTRLLGEVVDQLCARGGGRLRANQDPDELFRLCQMVRRLRPRVVVEIGSAKGGTLYCWSRLVEPGGLVVSIDLPGAVGSVRPVARSIHRRFGRERGVQVRTIDGDSHDPVTRQRLLEMLAERRVDVLFLDGDHGYEGVRADYDAYSPLVAPGGLIALHDIAIDPADETIQVRRFWTELKERGLSLESFIARPGASPGIGVVHVSAASAPWSDDERERHFRILRIA